MIVVVKGKLRSPIAVIGEVLIYIATSIALFYIINYFVERT